MKIIHSVAELGDGDRKVCLAIGVFDGVHLGHQQIIRQTIADARRHGGSAVVLTFDRHPNTIVAPDRVPPLIYSPAQKIRVIESLGAEHLLLLRFDRAFSEQTGEEFVRSLCRDVRRIQSICVGADFVFGHKRSGNVELLKKLGMELDFAVHGIPAVSLEGEMVSSTRIREVLRAGDFDAAGRMLGRPYALAGQVIAGEKLGHQLGFPTANLDTVGLLLPPIGVYAAHADAGGVKFRAVVNIGSRPTVPQLTPQIHVEVHLLDFAGDLYGQELEIAFVAKLRNEQKFASLDELKAQIVRDVAKARTIL